MTLEKAILATISYHDIFAYPLTNAQVLAFLIDKKTSQKHVNLLLDTLISKEELANKNELFFLKGKEKLAAIRHKRNRYSEKKLKWAKFYALVLRIVPTISAVCLTGALSMDNSDKNDDIDLLIITRKYSLWTSRFFANLLLFPFRRKPNSTKNSDKACLNIFLDEADLQILDQNIYTAHEICQMKLLWGINSYTKFLKANIWYKKYLPNWTPSVERLKTNDERQNSTTLVLGRIALVAEGFLRRVQLSYMSSKITIEKIGDTQAFFHPKQTQQDILAKYRRRIKKLS